MHAGPPPWPLNPLRPPESHQASFTQSEEGLNSSNAVMDDVGLFAQNMRRGMADVSHGSPELEDGSFGNDGRTSCTRKVATPQRILSTPAASTRNTINSPGTRSDSSVVQTMELENDAARCMGCLPWSRSKRTGEGAARGKEHNRCGESRAQGRSKSWWGYDVQERLERNPADGSQVVVNARSPSSERRAGELGDVEEGLRALAVSHANMKLDHERKLEELQASLHDFVAETRQASRQEPEAEAKAVQEARAQGAEEARDGKQPTAVEAALKAEVGALRKELERERDEMRTVIQATHERMLGIETRLDVLAGLEDKCKMAHLAAQDAGLQAAATRETMTELIRQTVSQVISAARQRLSTGAEAAEAAEEVSREVGHAEGRGGAHREVKSQDQNKDGATACRPPASSEYRMVSGSSGSKGAGVTPRVLESTPRKVASTPRVLAVLTPSKPKSFGGSRSRAGARQGVAQDGGAGEEAEVGMALHAATCTPEGTRPRDLGDDFTEICAVPLAEEASEGARGREGREQGRAAGGELVRESDSMSVRQGKMPASEDVEVGEGDGVGETERVYGCGGGADVDSSGESIGANVGTAEAVEALVREFQTSIDAEHDSVFIPHGADESQEQVIDMIIRGLQLDPEGACETSKDSPCAEGAVGDFVMAEIQGLQEEGGLDLDRYKEAVEGAGGGRGGPRMPLKDSARVNYPGGASGLGLSAETPKLKRGLLDLFTQEELDSNLAAAATGENVHPLRNMPLPHGQPRMQIASYSSDKFFSSDNQPGGASYTGGGVGGPWEMHSPAALSAALIGHAGATVPVMHMEPGLQAQPWTEGHMLCPPSAPQLLGGGNGGLGGGRRREGLEHCEEEVTYEQLAYAQRKQMPQHLLQHHSPYDNSPRQLTPGQFTVAGMRGMKASAAPSHQHPTHVRAEVLLGPSHSTGWG